MWQGVSYDKERGQCRTLPSNALLAFRAHLGDLAALHLMLEDGYVRHLELAILARYQPLLALFFLVLREKIRFDLRERSASEIRDCESLCVFLTALSYLFLALVAFGGCVRGLEMFLPLCGRDHSTTLIATPVDPCAPGLVHGEALCRHRLKTVTADLVIHAFLQFGDVQVSHGRSGLKPNEC